MQSLFPSLAPLRESREFRLLYAGQFVSGFGSALTFVGLPLQMYQLTRSPLQVGLLGVCEFVPMLLLAFVGGALADHWDRRRLLLAVETAMALACAGLALNAALPQPLIWPLWVGAAVLAGLGALHRPAMEAMTQQLIPPGQMTAVAALGSIRGNFAHIVGPGLAGVIAAVYGLTATFWLDCGTYLFSLLMIGALRTLPTVQPEGETLSWASLLEGWRYASKRQELLGTYLIDMNAMFFGMPNALFPALSERWGTHTIGLLYAAPSVGAILSSLTSGWATRVHRHGLAITWAAIVWGLGIIGFGLSAPLPLALAFLALAGAADNVSGIFRMTMWNQTIPAHLRGRTAAIEMISYLSGPYLGNAEAGLAARAFGLQTSVVSGGVFCVAGSVVLALLLPKFIRYRAAA